MLKKRLELIFLSVILLALSALALNYYNDYSFKNNEIPDSFKKRIQDKEQDILQHMQNNFGFTFKIPLVVTDKFQGRLYGLTAYEHGQITIYLNKNVMQESMDYMIDNVLAHEYAHALMFKLGDYSYNHEGHSKEWQQTCIKLGGADCRQYVDRDEIIMSKLPFK